MKPLIEIINTDNEPNIIQNIMDNKIIIGDKVNASITKNGYFINSYEGVVVGFTKNNLIKVKSWRGIKSHSPNNLHKL